ncbi:NDR1/HIN1-like protein 13 [Phragmites australis]|uniref:NDR1/HIN1-like protein 13 n=1 Tax=Phragmites australis TaxID=29695 RepID=UPI002D78EAFA|nr:NDR1/HIN1-like protein 13 [Phragmites australis]
MAERALPFAVQKDQIYCVPPPKNAYHSERYMTERAGGGKRDKGSSCSSCVLRTLEFRHTLGSALAAPVLLAAAVTISVVVMRPYVPTFTVDSLSVHNASRQQHKDYDFFLTAVNPNKLTALCYKDGGTARLLRQGTTPAKCDVGGPADGSDDAADFSVLLHGLQHEGRTPKAVEKGLQGSKDAVALQLIVEVAVQVHVGALGFGQRRLAVDCEISAAGLRKDAHISSQNRKSSFGELTTRARRRGAFASWKL